MAFPNRKERYSAVAIRVRDAAIEECAEILDSSSRKNYLAKKPGLAGHDASIARVLRLLKSSSHI